MCVFFFLVFLQVIITNRTKSMNSDWRKFDQRSSSTFHPLAVVCVCFCMYCVFFFKIPVLPVSGGFFSRLPILLIIITHWKLKMVTLKPKYSSQINIYSSQTKNLVRGENVIVVVFCIGRVCVIGKELGSTRTWFNKSFVRHQLD